MQGEAGWRAMVVDVSHLDGVPERLLAAHHDDGRGYCHGCHLPQSGDQKWPCTLYNLGVAARRHRLGVTEPGLG